MARRGTFRSTLATVSGGRGGPTAWPPGFFVCLAALYAVKEAKKYSAPAGNPRETGQVALARRIEATGRPPRVSPHPAHGHPPINMGLPKLTALRLAVSRPAATRAS